MAWHFYIWMFHIWTLTFCYGKCVRSTYNYIKPGVQRHHFTCGDKNGGKSDYDVQPVIIKLTLPYEWASSHLERNLSYQVNLNISVPSSLTTGKADTLLSTKIIRASWTDADSWTVAICLKVPIATSPICLWRNLGLGIIDPWKVCEGK